MCWQFPASGCREVVFGGPVLFFLSGDVALLILRILKKFCCQGSASGCPFLQSGGFFVWGVCFGVVHRSSVFFVFQFFHIPGVCVWECPCSSCRVMMQSSLFLPRPGVSLMVSGDGVGFVLHRWSVGVMFLKRRLSGNDRVVLRHQHCGCVGSVPAGECREAVFGGQFLFLSEDVVLLSLRS